MPYYSPNTHLLAKCLWEVSIAQYEQFCAGKRDLTHSLKYPSGYDHRITWSSWYLYLYEQVWSIRAPVRWHALERRTRRVYSCVDNPSRWIAKFKVNRKASLLMKTSCLRCLLEKSSGYFNPAIVFMSVCEWADGTHFHFYPDELIIK